ncbi:MULTISPECIES: ubiquinone-dependent pyruvate dehydrogenase [Peribacillus]|uniref:ubiquinone-dependent pyruvate dehydrogenase n=1 Tax=Peribacillus TaxID=2675229 RepID=UPI001912D9FC|nr:MULTISPECIES: ubiquinone-dependent pyruvate dehydrogenase [unclassified Peribacillus]MBK5446169.1 ubiquinone-dependent pyruvate dehydrogenase [Peribacillus sp. TH24]MBK5480976.1 ubiquinone-dependent pyruvate dehydrogenase [Peribacillus sp. TH16]MBK5502526.1 ubiquinone-dependent pyruvate dehydrogenase [Peribacillus sp. TH14]WMX57554.1 ubiquinone-dependent pyruvate dehydrogenase [Peribacillus sp. R9-11]
MKQTIADLLIDSLLNAGVKRIYGIVGDSLNAVLDSIRRSGKIDWISVRHEEVAAFAAGSDALLSNSIAVCAGSSGPGNLHLINGLYDCHRSRIPVLAIAAHIPSNEIGGDYFQQTNPEHLFKECSHFCEVVTKPEQMPRMVTMALQHSISRKGVSVLVLPGDVALLADNESVPEQVIHITQPVVRPSDEELKRLSEYLNSGKRITLLCGAGCEGAHAQLMQLCDKLKSPMVIALRGKEHLEYDNPYLVGLTGLIGYSSGYHAMMDCDVLLMLGTDFPYRQFLPKKSIILQVDIRAEHLGRRAALTFGLCGDVKYTVESLLPLLSETHDTHHLDKFVSNYRDVRRGLDKLAIGKPGRMPIHPQFLTKVISNLASEGTVFTCDVGTPTLWAARYLEMNGKRRLLGSFNHGTMANALPQAIGAQAARPEVQVVALSGDGGLSMLMGDLLTLRQHKLPVKVVVFNNNALGFVELEMKSSGYLETGTGLENPNFADVAQAMGIEGIRVEDPADLENAVKRAFSHNGPVVLDVVVNRQELSLPPSIKLEQAQGFTLWMLKAVLNGQGNDIVELAKTNLIR